MFMQLENKYSGYFFLLVSLFLLTACGGGGGGSNNGSGSSSSSSSSSTSSSSSSSSGATTYSIGGTLVGLTSGSITLQNNGADDLVLTADGDFVFPSALEEDNTYNVTILSEVENHTCFPINSLGIATSDISDITIDCALIPAFEVSLELVTDEQVSLEPYASSSSYWSRSFAINDTLYVIDRNSLGMWSLDVSMDSEWNTLEPFPGENYYGLSGTINGKAYVSEYASTKFWEYDPQLNEWIPLTDLPVNINATGWSCYNDLCYFPGAEGIYAFDPVDKLVELASEVVDINVGARASFLIDDNMYWYDTNYAYFNHFNLISEEYNVYDFPDNFTLSHTGMEPVVVIDGSAYIPFSSHMWVMDSETHEWTLYRHAISNGQYFRQGVVIDDNAYLLRDTYLYRLTISEE